jgi:hypothetical protein
MPSSNPAQRPPFNRLFNAASPTIHRLFSGPWRILCDLRGKSILDFFVKNSFLILISQQHGLYLNVSTPAERPPVHGLFGGLRRIAAFATLR